MNTNTDRINARCEILESLGFVIEHRDSVVTHPATDGLSFDFSATDDKMFVYQALKTVQKVAFLQGRNKLRAELHILLATD